MSLSTTTIIGRLTREPEVKVLDSGVTLASFSVAVDRNFKAPDGSKKTDFFNCVAWRKTAEFVQNYIGKGRLVAVSGRMESRQYEKEGQKHTVWDLVAENVQGLDKRQEDEGAPGEYVAPTTAPAQDDPFADSEDPFASE